MTGLYQVFIAFTMWLMFNYFPHPEFADVTDNLLKPLGNFSLAAALKDAKILPYFRSLSVCQL